MAISKEEILEAIASMTVMDVVDLIKAMEDKFGVSAAAATVAAVAMPTGAAAPAAEEQTEFTVTLTSFGGDKKVQVIKAIRAITSLGLKEAKDLVEGVPAVVKEAIPKAEAAKIKKELEEAGGTAEIK